MLAALCEPLLTCQRYCVLFSARHSWKQTCVNVHLQAQAKSLIPTEISRMCSMQIYRITAATVMQECLICPSSNRCGLADSWRGVSLVTTGWKSEIGLLLPPLN